MATESINSSTDRSTHQQLDRELRDMITQLTTRLSHLRQAQEGSTDDEDAGVRIITLAGTNTGATMKSEVGEHQRHNGIKKRSGEEEEGDEDLEEEEEEMGTLVNSNFQAVNNSIMLGGSFSSNDPGVRVQISGGGGDHHLNHRHRRHGHGHGMHKQQEQGKGGSSSVHD